MWMFKNDGNQIVECRQRPSEWPIRKKQQLMMAARTVTCWRGSLGCAITVRPWGSLLSARIIDS